MEKSLLEISGKTMLERVIDVLRQSGSIDRIIVASSLITPATTAEAKRLGVESIVTPGNGFEEDMRLAIRQLSLGEVLIVSSDLPFITVDVIKQAMQKYRNSGKPALAVMAPTELYKKIRSKPGYVFKVNGHNLVPVGINVLDGTRINEAVLEQSELIIDEEELALNVNTPKDLEIARGKAR